MKCLSIQNELKRWMISGGICFLLVCHTIAGSRVSMSPDPIHLFKIDKVQELQWNALRSNKAVRIFSYDQSFYQKIKTEKPALLNMMIPTPEGEVEVDLIENQVLNEDFVLSSDKQRNIAYTPGRFYKGKIKGIDSSFVTISLFDSEVYGIVSKPGQSNMVIGSTTALRRNTFMLFNDADVEAPAFSCGSEQLPTWTRQIEKINGQYRSSAAKCVDVYFEVGYNIFTNKGSEASAANFISSIFNATVSLYSNESISTNLSEIKVWTKAEPYASDYSSALSDFGDHVKTFNGDIAHFVRLNPSGSYHGIAWVDALCSDVPYAYSELSASYDAYPTYSWDVNVVTHEMGHNLGSPHTQSCTWSGGPIDNCYPQEGSCGAGPTPAKGGGTIMSYCHLVSSVGISFSNGFGSQPGNKIRSAVNGASCLGACGSSTGSGAIAQPDLQTTGITASPSTLTSLSQATTISWGTSCSGASAASSTSRAYFSNDNNLSSDDQTVGDIPIPSLSASASITNSLNYTLPATTSAGTYYFIVCADVNNTVAESSENNNCKSIAVILDLGSTTPPVSSAKLPDLNLKVTSTMPSVITAGLQLNVIGTINNIGDADAPVSPLSIVFSSDNIYSSNDQILSSGTMPALPMNSISTFAAIVSIPAPLTLSNYYIIVCDDPSNTISEKNKSNNCASYLVSATTSKPDHSISNVSISTNPILTGYPFNVSYVRKNISVFTSSAYSVGIYLSKTNNTYEAGDQQLGEQTFANGLEAGASANENFQISTKIDPGNYYIIICADNKNQITESNETNNCTAVAINIGNPVADLTAELINAPDKILINTEHQVTLRIKNIGLKKTEVNTTAVLYLSNTLGIENTSLLLGTMSVPLLDVNATKDTTFTLLFKDEALQGSKYLAYCVDQSNKITEITKANNCNSFEINISVPLPDIASVSKANYPNEIPKGGTIKFPFRMMNFGNLPAPGTLTEFYLSNKPYLKNGGYRFPVDSVGGIAPGDTINKNIVLQLPLSVQPGNYYFNVCLDYSNKIKESDKLNNCQSFRISIRKQYIDLEPYSFSLNDTIVYGGISTAVNLKIRNNGEMMATHPRVNVRYYSNNRKDTTTVVDFYADSILPGSSLDTTLSIMFDKKQNGQSISFEATVDPDNLISESIETNNQALFDTKIYTALPDLIPTLLPIADTVLLTGKDYIVKGIVSNSGKAVADSFKVALSLIDSTGRILISLGSFNEINLGISRKDTLTQHFTLPSAIFTGIYRIKLAADIDNKIIESDKSNNIITSKIKVIRALPDVALEQIQVSDSLTKGSLDTITISIKNEGLANMPSSTNEIKLSRTINQKSESHVIGTLSVPTLESGQSIDIKTSATIPADLITGTYEMKVSIDEKNSIEEFDKTNNAVTHLVVIPDTKADLDHIGIQLSGSSIYPGQMLPLTHFVQNDGETPGGSYEISYTLKKHVTDTSPVYVFQNFRCNDTILGGTLMEIKSQLAIPTAIEPGNYILSSCLDANNELNEITKKNNCSDILISIVQRSAITTAYGNQTLFSKIKMYPNPTSQWISLTGTLINAQEHLNIEIKDYSGRVISSDKLNSSRDLQYRMNVSTLAHGVYIVQLTTKKGIWKQTFVKL